MQKIEQSYFHDETECKGYVVYDNGVDLPRPGVLVAHDWSGRNPFACDTAAKMAKLGYVGFALDMFGNAQLGETNEEKTALIGPLVEDRALLQARVQCALQTLAENEYVDSNKIAIIGFCFGGLCALDLARTGADIRGAVSFHGLFMPANNISGTTIKAKILALHGHDDPMVPPDAVTALTQELSEADADWQIHIYGNTKHAFTNPQANDEALGTVYNRVAADRAWRAMENFLVEVFK